MSQSNTSGGLGVFSVVGVVLVVLKLAGVPPVVAWSWLWVLAPFWGPLALVLALFAVGAVLMGLGKALGGGR